MDDISVTAEVVGPRGGKQDKNVSIRLPSVLVEELDQIAQGNGEGRSELIRSILAGTLTIAGAGYSAEQIVQLKKSFVEFYRWISDPVESILYVLYRTHVALAKPDLQKEFVVGMAKNAIGWTKAMTPEEKEATLGRFQRTVGAGIKGLEDEDVESAQEFLAEKFLEHIQSFGPTRDLADKLKKTWELEDTEDENADQEALIQTRRAEGQSLAEGFAFFVSHLAERIELGLEVEEVPDKASIAREVSDTLIALIILAGTCHYYDAAGVHPFLRKMAEAAGIQDFRMGDKGETAGAAFQHIYDDFSLLVPPLYDDEDLRYGVRTWLFRHLFGIPLVPHTEFLNESEDDAEQQEQ